jgi:hypothetical protein
MKRGTYPLTHTVTPYIGGRFKSDSITLGSTVLHRAGTVGYWDTFVAKYDSSGNAVWAKKAQEERTMNLSRESTATTTGNLYECGWFNSPSIAFDATVLTRIGGLKTPSS